MNSALPVVSDEADWHALARLATDYIPELGDEGPLDILGPWADQVDVRVPMHRAALIAAVATAATLRHRGESSPLRRWAARASKRDPSLGDLRAFARAPLALWTLEEAVGDRWLVRDRSGLDAPWVPREPVRLDRIGGVDGGARVGSWIGARLVRRSDGPVACAGWVLPDGLDAARAEARVAALVEERRLACDHEPVAGILAREGHRLVAWAHRATA